MKDGIDKYHQFLDAVLPLLDPELIAKAQDVEYGQWEMPFETLLHGLTGLERGKVKLNQDFDFIRQLAEDADIVPEGVLDENTWPDFEAWYFSEG